MSKFTIHLAKEFIKMANPPYKQVVEAIINDEKVLKATKYISPNLIVRATRKSWRFNDHKTRATENIQIEMTIGRPNYVEREFIKSCQKDGMAFPLNQITIKYINPKPKKLKLKRKK